MGGAHMFSQANRGSRSIPCTLEEASFYLGAAKASKSIDTQICFVVGSYPSPVVEDSSSKPSNYSDAWYRSGQASSPFGVGVPFKVRRRKDTLVQK